MDRVAPVVVRRRLHERQRDARYWCQVPPGERLAMVAELRRRYHGWSDEARPELSRVHRIVARP